MYRDVKIADVDGARDALEDLGRRRQRSGALLDGGLGGRDANLVVAERRAREADGGHGGLASVELDEREARRSATVAAKTHGRHGAAAAEELAQLVLGEHLVDARDVDGARQRVVVLAARRRRRIAVVGRWRRVAVRRHVLGRIGAIGAVATVRMRRIVVARLRRRLALRRGVRVRERRKERQGQSTYHRVGGIDRVLAVRDADRTRNGRRATAAEGASVCVSIVRER